MPIIFSYPQISTVSNQDLFVISKTNTSTGTPETKSIEAEDLASYFASQLGALQFADDTAAGAGGLSAGAVYQTDGTGAAPLNVAGILMIKQ